MIQDWLSIFSINNKSTPLPVEQELCCLTEARFARRRRRVLTFRSTAVLGEQEIYSSIYKYEHTGLIPGYQSIAKYHQDIDTVVIQFVNTTNFDGYTWNLSEIVYNRIIRILRRK